MEEQLLNIFLKYSKDFKYYKRYRSKVLNSYIIKYHDEETLFYMEKHEDVYYNFTMEEEDKKQLLNELITLDRNILKKQLNKSLEDKTLYKKKSISKV